MAKEAQKSRKPPNTSFRQQRLKSWQPILTPRTVLPLLFVLGIIFAPIGGGLLYASSQVQELVIDYTDCSSVATSTYSEIPNSYVKSRFSNMQSIYGNYVPHWKLISVYDSSLSTDVTTCQIKFAVPVNLNPPLFMYYRLTNFYQNHRRYVKSLDEEQLRGEARTAEDIKGGGCSPLETNEDGKPYYPCGLIANSLFNDSFSSLERLEGGNDSLNEFAMYDTNIAWPSDKHRFKRTQYQPDEVVPPPNWVARYPNGYTVENMPDLSSMENLQVWMRTAGLPTFNKLARRNDVDVLEAGLYSVKIGLHFPVKAYDGTKSLVLTTRSVLGGKNPFLGLAYIIVSIICVILGSLFTIRHLFQPRKLADHRYLTWDTETNNLAPRTEERV
ncbi:CDC50 domain-containing protein [Schizosaccharomyces japonicus yFS275]|uniref:CDC50 domain-containing protein n=1 Tax=Schizosaccharomyces japonicus (strain yFS275 / FY16936) TaxID=402676 RepID=B6K2Q0_SCHJY|nr:CDC50 domain-containing protein [Schizosaccharomyces japonicus yFS275]EEB07431.1 CDC50 domain-containing protein [Schizosaccharomyces japonicus yFS275]